MVFLPETTLQDAKATHQKEMGQALTEEEFQKLLPGTEKMLVVYVSPGGIEESCDWIKNF